MISLKRPRLPREARRRVLGALAVGAACLAAAAVSLPAGEDLLRVEASMRPKSLSRGEEGVVVLKVILQPGLYISPHPAFTIEFIPGRELVFPKDSYTHSDLNMEVLEEGGKQYLNLQKPVEIPFTVSLEAKRGGHILEGKIKYFVLSKKEGWCLKNTARFSIPFFTRQTVKKK
jgi:hypothetical protein